MKRSCFRVVAFTVSIVLLCSVLSASGQTATGSLSGMVTDLMGIALPSAKIRVTQTSDRHRTFETTTDSAGKFNLPNLPAAVYRVSVTREDSGSTKQQVVSVRAGRRSQLEIRFSAGCDDAAEGVASDADKAEVIRATLSAVAGSRFDLLDRAQRERGIVLSTRNIQPEWVRGLEGLTVQLLTPEEIQRKANTEGDFLFLSVSEVRVRQQCIAVVVTNSWAVGARSKNVYLSGGGVSYEYRKQAGRWAGKFVSGWIS